jgi:hypothetical protein
LLDHRGRPLTPTWAQGTGRLQTLPNEAGFTLDEPELCLLDLIPGPPGRAYRFEAEVRHEQRDGQVGIFIGRRLLHDTPQGRQVFIRLAFSEEKRRGILQLEWGCYYIGRGIVRRNLQTAKFTPAGLPRAGRWRRLALVVRAGGVEAYLDGRKAADESNARLARIAATIDGPRWAPMLSGAMGAYALSAAASFRSVVVNKL